MEFIKNIKPSFILKAAIFATGFSGIVAEYVLSTMATYFLGDSVFQWTVIVSLMLFFMGIGSRVSKRINDHLIHTFLTIEVILSILVSFSSILVYTLSSFSSAYGFSIYFLCVVIGFLIGLEIPLVMRINEKYETLKTNVSSILENDFYGSLLGGMFFAFVGLPFLGLTYTPFVLGFVNLSVAILVALTCLKNISKPRRNSSWLFLSIAAVIIALGLSFTEPIIKWGEQNKYKDKIVFSTQTKYQKIVITEWKNDHWLYLNGNLQFCSMDEAMYHEPLVHPAMNLVKHPTDVLVLGGGDGCAAREILKYPSVKNIDLVDLDKTMTDLAKSHPILKEINQNALNHSKVNIHNQDAFIYMNENKAFYDVIIIDLPDPRTVELGRLYSQEFYKLCRHFLRPNGVIITQAGSPYYVTKAFKCIEKTMESADFTVAPMHNQILSMGQWGWIIGLKQNSKNKESLKFELKSLTFDGIETNWLNQSAMQHMLSTGKESFFINPKTEIRVNTIHDPVLYNYFLKGNWDLY